MNTINTHLTDTPVLVSDLIAIRESRHREKTRGVNHALMQHLAAFFGESVFIHDITEEFCVGFADFLLDRVSVNSTRTYLHKLHAVLEYALSCHIIVQNPMPPIRILLPRFKSPQRTYLSREEVIALESTPCCHSETKRAFLFACQTGLRLSDIESLRWDDIVDIDGAPTIVKAQVKTSREVRVPLNPIALQLLGEANGEGLVFSMMSRSVIATDLAQWAKEAGIGKRLTFHVSRHTFATLSISAGVDIYVVSKLCGHTSVRTTEIYAHMVDKTLEKGVNLLCSTMMNLEQKKQKLSIPTVFHGLRCVVEKMFRLRKLRHDAVA